MQVNLVITSAASITPYGLDVSSFAKGIAEGPVTFSPLEGCYIGSINVAKVPEYNARKLLATRIISNFDRLTLHVCVAVEQLYQSIGLTDSQLRTEALADHRVSFVCGTSGPLQSIVNIDLQTIEAPNYLQPSFIPNLVFNSPASYATIRHGIRGSCITITDGDTSSLQAFAVAAAQLLTDRVDFALVGGAEEATPAYALYRAAMADSSGKSLPPLSEGATIFSIEREEHAVQGGRSSLAKLIGCAHVFSPKDTMRGLVACMDKLREQVGTRLDNINVVCAEENIDLSRLGLEHARRLVLTTHMGETGAMYGTLAVLKVLTKADVAVGSNILLMQISREGACVAILLQKDRNIDV